MQHRQSISSLKLVTIGVVSLLPLCAQETISSREDVDTAHWKKFTNKAGWELKYPPTWSVSSCVQCPDPTAPDVFVFFSDDKSHEAVMIDHLIDKPPNKTLEQWLQETSITTVLTPRMSEEWFFLDGVPVLKVRNRNPDFGRSENIYLVNGSNTIAIRISNVDKPKFYLLAQQLLSTIRLTRPVKR